MRQKLRPREPHRRRPSPFSPSFLSSFTRRAWKLFPSKLQSSQHDEYVIPARVVPAHSDLLDIVPRRKGQTHFLSDGSEARVIGRQSMSSMIFRTALQ